MLSLKNSLAVLKKTEALKEGHFVLSSGLHSSKYVQCAKLLSFPSKAGKLCRSLAFKIKKGSCLDNSSLFAGLLALQQAVPPIERKILKANKLFKDPPLIVARQFFLRE